ncbi:hypothetical protein GCM10017559_66010 [Streptosporangium longisporum]|uniref:Secreted protein n=1 Tax=Streptosporangium longisporum TaxID=46187 RepID=A0ABP6L1Z5_9ACTN
MSWRGVMVIVSPVATFMPHCRAQYGQWVAVPAFTGGGAGSETGMDPMVLSGGFTARSPLLPMCYKPLTAFTCAMRRV